MATALRPQNNFVVVPHSPKETAYGTAVADASITQMYALSEPSLAEIVRDKVDDAQEIKGHEFPDDTAKQVTLFQDATIPLTFPASTELAGLLFGQALGVLTTAGVTAPFTHTITAQDGKVSDQLPSISLVQGVRGLTTTYQKYKGVVVNEIRFNVDNRGRIRLGVTYFTDGNEAALSGFTIPASFASATPIFGKDATFKIVNAGGTLVDQSTLLRSFDLTWNNNLDRNDAHSIITDGVNLKALRFANRSLTLTIRIWGSKGDAIYSDFSTDTLKYIQLKVTNGANNDITFDFNRCIITQLKDSFQDIRNVLELTVKPFVTTASTGISPMTVTVRNAISAYLA